MNHRSSHRGIRPASVLPLLLIIGSVVPIGCGVNEAQAVREGAAAVEKRAPRSDWPGLFGPFNDAKSSEDASHLNLDWPEAGPPVKWRYAIGEGYSAPVVRDGRLIIFHRRGDEEILESLDAETGKPQWEFRGPTKFKDRFHYSSGPYATPAIGDKHVYAIGAEARAYCVELTTGKKVWERALQEDYTVPRGMFAAGASPLLVDNLLVFNLGAKKDNAGIIALDKTTGKTVWAATDHRAGLATPRIATIHGRKLLFVFTFEGLVCLEPAGGRVLWMEDYRANSPEKVNATTPVINDDLVLISAEARGSRCLRVLPDGKHETVWTIRRGLQSQYCTMIEVDGYVYAFDAVQHSFVCLRLSDRKIKWRWPEPGNEGITRGSAIAVGDRFILYGDRGRLATLQINSHKPIVQSLTKAVMQPECLSFPALANGLLYLRSEHVVKHARSGELVCFDLRADSHPAKR